MGRPRSLFESSASVTVVIFVMLATFAFRAVAMDVASAAIVGVGAAVGVAEGVGVTEAGEDDAAAVA